MYCGYDCDTMMNNVFAYGPDDKVFFAAIIFPGSWVDGSLTAHFLHYLRGKIGKYKICVNQGFPRSGNAYKVLVGLVTKRQAWHLHHGVHYYLLRISHLTHWSSKQVSGVCVGFRIRFLIKNLLPVKSEEHHLVLEAIVLAHNFFMEYVGYSQIHLLPMGWRNFFQLCCCVSFLVVAGNSFWCYLEYQLCRCVSFWFWREIVLGHTASKKKIYWVSLIEKRFASQCAYFVRSKPCFTL